MKILVTGGAGFIGSHLVDKLAEKGHEITVFDNLSKGKINFLKKHKGKNYFTFIKGDIMDTDSLRNAVRGSDIVYHLAGNSDTIKGIEITNTDLILNTTGTYNVLEAMRLENVKKIVFTSTSTVYGYVNEKLKENYGPLKPTSLYGASKLASEGFISAFCHTFSMQSWIFRFANILGPRITHGAVFDFINKLKKNPKELEILGDGNQFKPYVHVSDCVNGMIMGVEKSKEKINIFNISADTQTTVKEIAKIVSREMGLDPKFKFTGGEIGWRGDLPSFFLESSEIKSLGWKTKYTSTEAVEVAVREILASK